MTKNSENLAPLTVLSPGILAGRRRGSPIISH